MQFVSYGPVFTSMFFHSALVQVEIYVTVDDVDALGASAATRSTISATATADTTSAMNTLVRQSQRKCNFSSQ